ncbi:MAG: pyruvate, phosphate dikinase [Deltaproteobacteria bacterium HGW-Deltaproteobacteria-8]|jgi:pyruvate,water dikinase|nr:MAG: pyruvate, phosphate dikinase [Deltaproteobacteria bacterium HGW-Deltaproteobacteria-8]
MTFVSRWFNKALGAWRDLRNARASEALGRLKARYHAFRVLLADNELALERLALVERALASRDRSDLSEAATRLMDTTFDLVDGLNRITGGGHMGLFERQDRLAQAVRRSLAAIAPSEDQTPTCLALADIDADQRRFCGGKAATLAQLRRSGLPVPDGFVATTKACRRFLSASGLEAKIRRSLGAVELGKAVEAATQEIRREILAAPVPGDLAAELVAAWERLGGGAGAGPAVSVRSSALVEDKAEHSFAGQFHTELNVTTAKDLLEAFREVVAGNFGPSPTSYRRQAGLPLVDFDMAVLCQVMVPARCAGVLFTVDPAAPESGRMLLTAVHGLGTSAVGGDAPVDVFHPARDASPAEEAAMPAEIADKDFRDELLPGGGLRRVAVSEAERRVPVLDADELRRLVRYARMIESLAGQPQDIEWAMTPDNHFRILQARPVRLAGRARASARLARGAVLLDSGVTASPGRAVGQAHPARSAREADPEHAPQGLRILVLRHSMVEAAQVLPEYDGVVVELGNPADHLSCVARELSIPMLTGVAGAMDALRDGQWIILDADQGEVLEAPEEAWSCQAEAGEAGAAPVAHGQTGGDPQACRRRTSAPAPAPLPPDLAALHDLLVPLNLTDAYGPTFSPVECKTAHDLVRYVHEMAVLAMFDAGDAVLEDAGVLLRRLNESPIPFLLIDFGGGLAAQHSHRNITLADVRSVPLLALCEGMATPGLRWREAPPVGNVGGVLSRALLDGRSARPVGNFNYALVARDYLNVNARVEFHFAMVDAVCGPEQGENYVRFRFKGGGTAREQRERRVQAVSEILKAHGFFTDRRGDMVTATLSEPTLAEARERLVMLGRLLGFTRLLDAAMVDDEMPGKVARAFLEGDYALEGISAEQGVTPQA